MKKIISFILVAIMLLACASCGGGTPTNRRVLVDIGDFTYGFKDYELVKDDLGNDVILITYEFTNKSDEVHAFVDSSYYEALQNEETLNETTIYVSEDSMETVTDMEYEEIDPGETLEVKIAFELLDTTSAVTVVFTSFNTGMEKSHTIDITLDVSGTLSAPSIDDEDEDEDEDVADSFDGQWNDQWYGWWMIGNPTGEFADYDGVYFDCCAAFEPNDEDMTILSIWDEEYSNYENNCLAEIYFTVDGTMAISEGGYFFAGDVEKDALVIDRDFSDYDNTIFFTADVETEEGAFTALVYLTKWGYEWDEDFADAPTYYDSYFLPLMEDGKALPADISDID